MCNNNAPSKREKNNEMRMFNASKNHSSNIEWIDWTSELWILPFFKQIDGLF